MEALVAFAAALLALRLTALLARRRRATGRPELAAWTAALFAYAVASAALTWGAAAGWDSRSFRVYYLFGGLLTAPLLGVGSLLLYGWRRVAAPALVYVGLAVGIAISAARGRGLRRQHPRRPGPPRSHPRQARGDRGERHGNVGRRGCRNRHDQAPASGQRADPGRGWCCRPGHRSIRLGCSENGAFCCNCSTSSLRRFYSLATQSALTHASFPGLTRLTSTRGPRRGSSPDTVAFPSGEHAGPSNEGVLLLRQNLRLLPVLAFILLGLAALTATRPADAREKKVAVLAPSDAGIVKQIRHYRRATWHWQSVMGVKRTRANRTAERDPSRKFKLWVRNLWKQRAKRARTSAVRVPHKSGWLCIHRYEGAWNSATGNGYYGGLQMDIELPAAVRAAPASQEGHREQLDAARADVGRRARTPERPRLLPVAQHGALLRPDLVSPHGPRLTSDQTLAQRPAAQEEGSREARRPRGQGRSRGRVRAPAIDPREAGQERRIAFLFSPRRQRYTLVDPRPPRCVAAALRLLLAP